MLENGTSNSSPDPARPHQGAASRLAVDSVPRQESAPRDEPPPQTPLSGAPPEPSASAPAGEIPIIPPFETARRADDNATRPLFGPDRWVSDQEFWETNTFIALSGRHAIPRPKTLPLRPPQRFHPMPRWRSYLLLTVVCLMIIGTLVGLIAISRFGAQVFGLQRPVSSPAPAHTTTPAHPTETPKKSK